MVEDLESTEVVDAAQADLEFRLARLWSAIEFLDHYSWRVLEGVVVDEDARAALTAAYTSATAAARSNGLLADVRAAVRSTLTVVAAIEEDVSWAAKRWVEYATTALVCRMLLDADTGTTSDEPAEAAPEATGENEPDTAEPRLVGGDFGWVEYEILTCTWRSVVGELHPDDPALTEDPPEESDDVSWWLEPVDGVEVGDAAPTDSVDDLAGNAARTRMGVVWTYLNRPVSFARPRARRPKPDTNSGRRLTRTARNS